MLNPIDVLFSDLETMSPRSISLTFSISAPKSVHVLCVGEGAVQVLVVLVMLVMLAMQVHCQ